MNLGELSKVVIPSQETGMGKRLRLSEKGTPRALFQKDVIRVGTFHADGKKFTVTPETLDHWERTFASMSKAGVKVPIPSEHTFDPEKNLGWVKSLKRDGDRLVMQAEIIGHQAIEMAERNDVSIYATKDFTDGSGNTYTWPIRHVAMTPTPVVPGLNGFVRIAASQAGASGEDAPVASTKENSTMPLDVKKIAKNVGIEAEVTEDTFAASLTTFVTGLTTKATDAAKKITDLEGELQLSKNRVLELEKTKNPGAPDPTILRLSGQNRNLKIESLLKEGKITPASAKQLKETWIGKDNSALKLSFGESGDKLFDETMEAFEQIDVIALGERMLQNAGAIESPLDEETTKAQQKEVSEIRASMRKYAGLKPKKTA